MISSFILYIYGHVYIHPLLALDFHKTQPPPFFFQDSQDHHGNTALHLAAMLGKKEMVHLLLAHGALVKVKNKLGWTPLAEAIRYRRKKEGRLPQVC